MTVRQGVAMFLAAASVFMSARGDDDDESPAAPEPTIPVNIQPVRLALDDGSEAVAIDEHFDFEEVSRVWKTAGIQLTFQAPIQLDSSEFYDLTLPERDAVMEKKPDRVKELLESTPSNTIVALFVNELSDSCACHRYNGWGNIPGTLLIVDTDGPASPSIGAAVLAHELGHNFSLVHKNGDNNLMNSEVAPWMVTLTDSQIADARKTAEQLANGSLVSKPRTPTLPKRQTIPGDQEMWFYDGQFFVRFRDLKISSIYTVQQSSDMRSWINTETFTAETRERLWIDRPGKAHPKLFYRLQGKDGFVIEEPEEKPKVVTKPRRL